MCLAVLALGTHARFPLVLASNRDEFFERPTAPLDWWPAAGQAGRLLAGRDLQAGGAWLGLAEQGRLALVTNVRRSLPPAGTVPVPSRGALVPAWLQGGQHPVAFSADVAAAGHRLFNLLALDVRAGHAFWLGSDRDAPQPLGPGLHGLSNAALDTPWPKLQLLKARLAEALAEVDGSAGRTAASVGSPSNDSATAARAPDRSGAPSREADQLTRRLFDALGDRSFAADDQLPDTGLGQATERWLSSVFIRSPDGRYGTRSSSVVVAEQTDAGLQVTVSERCHDQAGIHRAERRFQIPDWAPAIRFNPAP